MSAKHFLPLLPNDEFLIKVTFVPHASSSPMTARLKAARLGGEEALEKHDEFIFHWGKCFFFSVPSPTQLTLLIMSLMMMEWVEKLL